MSVLFPSGVASGSTERPTQLSPGYRSSGGETDPYKSADRPTVLAVNGNVKDFKAKHTRSGSGDSDEGSLPCTPELRDCDGELGSAESEALAADTRPLILRFIAEDCGSLRPRWKDGKPLSTMKRVVCGLLEKHRITYNGTFELLFLHRAEAYRARASLSMKYKGGAD